MPRVDHFGCFGLDLGRYGGDWSVRGRRCGGLLSWLPMFFDLADFGTACDFNGDGLADVVARTDPVAGGWVHPMAQGLTLRVGELGRPDAGWRDVQSGDFNGDGHWDIAGRSATGGWWIAPVDGSGFATQFGTQWDRGRRAGPNILMADANGDAMDDIVGRTSTNAGRVARSTGSGFVNECWGYWSPRSPGAT